MGKEQSIHRSIEKIKRRKNILSESDSLIEKLHGGDRTALSRAITLLESTNADHRKTGEEILAQSMSKTGNAKRIGITGVPGVGKSTFIEAFGSLLIEVGHKVAVLAIDPSSQRTGGSILGDKTRMETLAANSAAFIRPSPAGSTLGGVAARTRESMLLCEAAGYDIIIVETVGVGQSETAVHSMVDFFLLLMLAGAGDELQGIKRGIMEMADAILINKADGANIGEAEKARMAYKQAIHLFPPKASQWHTPVEVCSALKNQKIDTIWESITSYFKDKEAFVKEQRTKQNLHWFRGALSDLVDRFLTRNEETSAQLKTIEVSVAKGEIDPLSAAQQLFQKFIGRDQD